ncbi:MAG: hypothetical protein ACRDGS_10980, partial [Chloroflexota bacterium]
LFILGGSMAAHARQHGQPHSDAKAAAPTAPASGAIVMAGGIFVLAALQRIPGGPGVPTDCAALALIGTWAFLAWVFARAVHARQLPNSHPAANFAMGTWVAATAILAEVMMLAFPRARPVALAFAGLATGLWGWYLWIAARGFRELVDEHGQVPVTGTVLLTAVSTQSLVLAWQSTLPHGLPLPVSRSLLALGLLLYLVGAALIGFGLGSPRTWTLLADWRAPRCILHGALSITGLATLTTRAAPSQAVVGLWLLVVSLFVVVESMEVLRLGLRIRAHGWRYAVVIYHPAQWARNFTFGMLYAFTLALDHDMAAIRQDPWAAAFWGWLARWGQYAVLVLLLAEGILLLIFLSHARWSSGSRPATGRLIPRSAFRRPPHHRTHI